MYEIITICKIHGALTIYNVFPHNKKGIVYYECKICTNLRNKKYRLNNKEKINEIRKKYRERCPEIEKKYREKYREKIKVLAKKYRSKNTEKLKLIRIQQVKNLDDHYIKGLYASNSKIKYKNVPEELIEVKRIHLKLVRKLKELKNGNNQCSGITDFPSK